MTLALLAMPAHYLAPFRWKKPLFVAVSIAGLFLVAGPWASAIVLAIAAVFIGVCLPADPLGRPRRRLRRDGRGHRLVAAGLAAAGVPDDAWAIAASMLMFRMIMFLYELKHASGTESPLDADLLLLPAAELLLPAFPGGRLPDHAARVFRRRRPRDPAPRPGDDVPGDAPPPGVSPGLPADADLAGRACRGSRT